MDASIHGLARRLKPRGDMQEMQSFEITAGDGVEGDYRGKHMPHERKVSVLFENQWQAACDEAGTDLPWTARRANILVKGHDTPQTIGTRLKFGDVELEVLLECDPCSRMEDAHEGMRQALMSNWRGGVLCQVLQGGKGTVGDAATLRPPPEVTPGEVVAFWFEEVAPALRFRRDPDLDRQIADRFGPARAQALAGMHDSWAKTADGALALLLLLDQFSRNLFREDGRAFEADPKAREIAGAAITAGMDTEGSEEKRMFFYLPYTHSEELADQDRCVELFGMLSGGNHDMHHAHSHRELIQRFGRFPYRNEMLGRETTAEEKEYLAGDGYRPGSVRS